MGPGILCLVAPESLGQHLLNFVFRTSRLQSFSSLYDQQPARASSSSHNPINDVVVVLISLGGECVLCYAIPFLPACLSSSSGLWAAAVVARLRRNELKLWPTHRISLAKGNNFLVLKYTFWRCKLNFNGIYEAEILCRSKVLQFRRQFPSKLLHFPSFRMPSLFFCEPGMTTTTNLIIPSAPHGSPLPFLYRLTGAGYSFCLNSLPPKRH